MTVDSNRRTLAPPSQCTPKRNQNSLPRSCSYEVLPTKTLTCLAMATHNETDNVDGKSALCARGASGEEYTEVREKEDRGTDVGRLVRVRELPLGSNLGEK